MLKISMPLAFTKGKKKKRVPLSMNRYRTAHFYESNWAKKEYKKLICEQVEGKTIDTPARITMVLWVGSKRRIDLDNRCIVQSKFLGDALQEC